MKKTRGKRIIVIVALVIGACLLVALLNEKLSQFLFMMFFLAFMAWLLAKSLEKTGVPEIIAAIGFGISAPISKLLSKTPFAEKACAIYNIVIAFLLKLFGANEQYTIQAETGIVVSFALLAILFIFISNNKKSTAIKRAERSSEQKLNSRDYADKSKDFCKTIQQRIRKIDKESNWNENLFTPIDAEVEVNINDKFKRKYDDMLKCLKSMKRKGEIFLVLGDPGSGKSVALRKLCLELLAEFEKTKRIPVYINLKKWDKNWTAEHPPTGNDLIEFITDSLREEGDFFTDRFLDEYFEVMLQEKRWYFIFDSFDEMPCLMGEENSDALIDTISNLLCNFLNHENQDGGIIASRLYKAPSQSLGVTVTLHLQSFNDLKIKTMIYKYLGRDSVIIQQLFKEHEELVVLCRNPFYLSLLISYISNNETAFPQNQMELYNNFVNTRIDQCAQKLSEKKVSRSCVLEAAEKIASTMQQSEQYGLECPVSELRKLFADEDFKESMEVLEYAKICRIGGQPETISFVHRRFQEFFYVKDLLHRQQTIEDDAYECITSNTGLRDALVLYCEIADDTTAEEIAQYCWSVIKKNIRYKNNISEPGCLALVNTLYFLSDAFRNRKTALASFAQELAELVDKSLARKTDFVVSLALTQSLDLIEHGKRQSMVMKVFALNNHWLNDVVVQNCRMIKQLDIWLEREFYHYFQNMKITAFLQQFKNFRFTFSLSENFQRVRRFQTALLISYIATAFSWIVLIGTVAIYGLTQHGFSQLRFIDSVNERNIQELLLANLVPCFVLMLLLIIPIIAQSSKAAQSGKLIQLSKLYAVSFYYIWLVKLSHHSVLNYSVFAIVYIACFIPDIINVVTYCYDTLVKKKIPFGSKQVKKMIKSIIRLLIMMAIVVIIILVLGFLSEKLLTIISVAWGIIGGIGVLFILGFICRDCMDYFHDMKWIKNTPVPQKISRRELEKHFNDLKTRKGMIKYAEKLNREQVVLEGRWKKGSRPRFVDDRLEVLLATLDCKQLKQNNFIL